MGDSFSDAVREGQRAALDAERSRKEIESVVCELDATISQRSGGKVRVARNPGAEGIYLVDPASGRVLHDLVLVSGEKRLTLCRFQEGPRGYPVEISYPGGFAAPTDRASLVMALRDVLSTPAVGSIFNELLGPPADAETDPSAP